MTQRSDDRIRANYVDEWWLPWYQRRVWQDRFWLSIVLLLFAFMWLGE